MQKIKRLPIGTIVTTKLDCREVYNNYLVLPKRYIIKAYKKVYDEYCVQINLLDFQDTETGVYYLVPADKIYQI